MITLTIDPKRLPDPLQAYQIVHGNRRISRLVEALWNRDRLLSRKYVAVLELHESGYPHFHVVVEGKKFDAQDVETYWKLPRAYVLGNCHLGGQPIGRADVSLKPRRTRRDLAQYLAKLRTAKAKEFPPPPWVLKADCQLRRLTMSRDIVLDTDDKPPEPLAVESEIPESPRRTRPTKRRPNRTQEERLAKCGTTSVVLEQNPASKLPGRFRAKVDASVSHLADRLGIEKGRHFFASAEQLTQIGLSLDPD